MTEARFPLYALSRLRMELDGRGVTTLVAAQGCPLRCKYCINRDSVGAPRGDSWLTTQELYDRVRIDDLYFRATGGGVTFGGGEPLLYAAFIREFRMLCGDAWRLNVETSLNVPEDHVRTAIACVDTFIVDIKDTDSKIYRAYTRRDNALVLQNLALLIREVGAERVLVRVPEIPGFNTDADVERSLRRLRAMGVEQFDCFRYTVAEQERKKGAHKLRIALRKLRGKWGKKR